MGKKKHRKNREAAALAQGAPAAVPAAPAGGERFPGWLAWPAALGWAGFVLWTWFSRYPVRADALAAMLDVTQYFPRQWAVFPEHLLNLLSGLFLLGGAWAGGRAALRLAGFAFHSRCEEAFFSSAAGLGLMSAAMLALGALKLLYAPLAVGVMALFWAAGALDWYLRREDPGASAAGPAVPPPSLSAGDKFVLGAIGLAALVNLAGALAPEIFYDSLVYHLAVPNYYAIKHGLADMPYNLYSNLPLAHGMLYSGALLLHGEVTAKLVNWAALLLSALGVFALGRRHFSDRAGLWAALFFYAGAHVMMSSWSAGTEALLTLFSLASLYAVLNVSAEDRRWLPLAALAAGFAMGVKYTGLFTALAAGAAHAWRLRGDLPRLARDGALFALLALLPLLPWLAKNQVYRSNPVFPFMAAVFGDSPGSDPARLKAFIGETRQFGERSLKDWAGHVWGVHTGRIANSELFTPVFLALLPAAFLLGRGGPAAGGLWVFFIASWLLWSLSSTMIRFLMPAYPAGALLAAHYLLAADRPWLRRLLSAGAFAAALAGLYWASYIFYSQGRWLVPLGQAPREAYLSRTQPTYPYSHYAGISFLNSAMPPSGKALIVGDGRSFYMERDFIVSSVFDKTPLVEYALASASAEEMCSRMKADGITHMLLNVAEAIKIGRGYGVFYFDERSRRLLPGFWSSCLTELRTFDETDPQGRPFNRVAVYSVGPRPPAAPVPVNYLSDAILPALSQK